MSNVIKLQPLPSLTERLKNEITELLTEPPYGEMTVSEVLGVFAIIQYNLIESLE